MDWDTREQGELQVTYRAHLREMTTARQAADRARGVGARDQAARRARMETYTREMARIAEEHDIWLAEHGMAEPPALRKPFSRGYAGQDLTT